MPAMQQLGGKRGGADDPEATRMSLGEHLEELRGRILRSLAAIVVCCLVCIWPSKWLLVNVVARPLILVLQRHGQPTTLLSTSPVENLLVYIKVVLFCGALLSAPYVIYQIWGFVAAGLYRHEKRWIYELVPVSVGLFFAGVVFMYTLVLLVSLNFLVGFSSWFRLPDVQPTALETLLLQESHAPTSQPAPFGDAQPEAGTASADGALPATVALLTADPVDPPAGQIWFNLRERQLKVSGPDGVYTLSAQRSDQRALVETHFKLGEYLTFVLVMTLAFGLAFQIPLAVVFVARTGILSAADLARYRKVAILLIVIVAGMIAPPDLMSHLLLSGPMVLLFELGLWWARREARRKAASA
jgi:Tat protein translocase TatC